MSPSSEAFGLQVSLDAMESSPVCTGLPVWLHVLLREEHPWCFDDDFWNEGHPRRNLDVLLCYEGEGKDRIVDECNGASRSQIALAASSRAETQTLITIIILASKLAKLLF